MQTHTDCSLPLFGADRLVVVSVWFPAFQLASSVPPNAANSAPGPSYYTGWRSELLSSLGLTEIMALAAFVFRFLCGFPAPFYFSFHKGILFLGFKEAQRRWWEKMELSDEHLPRRRPCSSGSASQPILNSVVTLSVVPANKSLLTRKMCDLRSRLWLWRLGNGTLPPGGHRPISEHSRK